MDRQSDKVSSQSNGQVCDRRTTRGHRSYRKKNNRRHLWRHGQTWRRSILWQGSFKSRQVGLLYGKICGQKHSSCWTGGEGGRANCVCNKGGCTYLYHGRYFFG